MVVTPPSASFSKRALPRSIASATCICGMTSLTPSVALLATMSAAASMRPAVISQPRQRMTGVSPGISISEPTAMILPSCTIMMPGSWTTPLPA